MPVFIWVVGDDQKKTTNERKRKEIDGSRLKYTVVLPLGGADAHVRLNQKKKQKTTGSAVSLSYNCHPAAGVCGAEPVESFPRDTGQYGTVGARRGGCSRALPRTEPEARTVCGDAG